MFITYIPINLNICRLYMTYSLHKYNYMYIMILWNYIIYNNYIVKYLIILNITILYMSKWNYDQQVYIWLFTIIIDYLYMIV